MGLEGAGWGACAILRRALRESLTEKMIFEQKPEVKERENHSRIQIHIFLTERTSAKALRREYMECLRNRKEAGMPGPRGVQGRVGKHALGNQVRPE